MKNTFFPSKLYGDKQGQCDMGDGKLKLLPHIVGEYEYRITNKLLVHKILNPRRDKLIMDSLLNASNVSCSHDKSKIQAKTSHSFYRKKKNNSNQRKFAPKNVLANRSKDHCISYVNQTETPSFEVQKNISVKQNSKVLNPANYIGRIKKNNFISTLDLNSTLDENSKSGRIVHQSCFGNYARENLGQAKFLKRVKIQKKRYFSKEGFYQDDKNITYDQPN